MTNRTGVQRLGQPQRTKWAWWFPKALAKIIPNVDIEGEQLMEQLEAADAGNNGQESDGEGESEPEPEAERELVGV